MASELPPDLRKAADRRHVRTSDPYEKAFGYARAVQAGDLVVVSGCTAYSDGVIVHEGDPYEQAKAAFAAGLKAVEEFGLGVRDVVRTRMYLTHPRDVEAVGRAHKELFGDVRPAATMLVVSGFMDSRMLVEVEIDAYRSGGGAGAGEPARDEESGGRAGAQEAGAQEAGGQGPVDRGTGEAAEGASR
jgi:enamine deaminase RidA (YjgF/YER057c/UK114 family)